MSKKNRITLPVNARRYFRRSNVYIAEYIIMLVMMAALAGVSAALIYDFFKLLRVDGFEASALVNTVSVLLSALVVLAPGTFWFYARVTGQEMVEPAVRQKTTRTVLLSVWLIGMFITAALLSVSLATGVVGAILGTVQYDGVSFVTTLLLPGVLSISLFCFIIISVARRSSRKGSQIVGVVLGSIAIILFVANLSAALVKTDSTEKASNGCTYREYLDTKCSYRDYKTANPLRPTMPGSSPNNRMYR